MLQGPEFLGPQARGRGVIPRGPIEIEESGINDDDGRGPNINHFINSIRREPLNEDGSACDRAAVRPLRSQILPHTTGDERNTYPRPNTYRPVGRRATVPPRRRYVSWAPTTTGCIPARQPSEQMTLNRGMGTIGSVADAAGWAATGDTPTAPSLARCRGRLP